MVTNFQSTHLVSTCVFETLSPKRIEHEVFRYDGAQNKQQKHASVICGRLHQNRHKHFDQKILFFSDTLSFFFSITKIFQDFELINF